MFFFDFFLDFFLFFLRMSESFFGVSFSAPLFQLPSLFFVQKKRIFNEKNFISPKKFKKQKNGVKLSKNNEDLKEIEIGGVERNFWRHLFFSFVFFLCFPKMGWPIKTFCEEKKIKKMAEKKKAFFLFSSF